MPRLRHDLHFVPSVSWTQGQMTAAVSYGSLVATSEVMMLLPRSGAETAGFALSLSWLSGAPTAEHMAHWLSDPTQHTPQLMHVLGSALPQWSTRLVFPLHELSRFEIMRGLKSLLGISIVLQCGPEEPVAIRMSSSTERDAVGAFYGR